MERLDEISDSLPAADEAYRVGGAYYRVTVRKRRVGRDLVLFFRACECDDQGGGTSRTGPPYAYTIHEGKLAENPQELRRVLDEGRAEAVAEYRAWRGQVAEVAMIPEEEDDGESQ